MKALLVCNAYPSDGNLYRNGFIHRRVKMYQAAGLDVRIFYHHEPVTRSYSYIYDEVEVVVGNRDALETCVQKEYYDVFLVHFAEPERVAPLLETSKPIIVWIHGFEAEGWHRRWFNYLWSPSLAEELIQKKYSYYKEQNKFIRELILEYPDRVTFVHISDWFRQMVVEPDVGAEFTNFETIPNFIDTDLFSFTPKNPKQRLKILSIRPFASYKYANDQSVEAIKILSGRPYFNDLQFEIYGEGKLFESTTGGLKGLKNVRIRNKFLTQTEIAKIHGEFGVFLAPTRFDSQGVSTGEAMSSGLVPISSKVSAIPEFISDGISGLLAMPESPESIADCIEELYFDSELFNELSVGARSSVSKKCGREATIDREVALIFDRAGL